MAALRLYPKILIKYLELSILRGGNMDLISLPAEFD